MISWFDFKILGIFWFCLSQKIKWRFWIKGEKEDWRDGRQALAIKPDVPSPVPGPTWCPLTSTHTDIQTHR